MTRAARQFGRIGGVRPCRGTRRMAAVAAVLGLLALPAASAAQEAPADEKAGALARLEALLEAMRSGDRGSKRAFVEEAYAPSFRDAFPMEAHVGYLTRERLPEVRGAGALGPHRAGAELYDPLTETADSLWVEVEAEPPHRVVGIRDRPGAGSVATDGPFLTDAERAAELRRYVGKLAAADVFSGVVLLAKDGRPVFFEAYGEANKDFGSLVGRGTKFNLGSMNKMFTATVIAMLVEEGKLAWDDPLSKFVPDFPSPEEAGKVRIEHLLTHTSGLGSYFNERFFESSRARWRTVDEMMELARPDSLRFEPGTDRAYSNTGFLVLGAVIEAVTGEDYFEVVQQRIYDRVGMPGSGSFELDRVNPNLAVGYIRETEEDGVRWRNNLFEHVIRGGPAGGGYSTAGDLVRFADALRSGLLVSPETLERMRTPKPELSSPDYGYGIGLAPELDAWGHGGGFAGISADLSIYGDTGWTAVVLANYGGAARPVRAKIGRMLAGAGEVAARR